MLGGAEEAVATTTRACLHTHGWKRPQSFPEQVIFSRQLIMLRLVTMVMHTVAVTRISVAIQAERNKAPNVHRHALEEESITVTKQQPDEAPGCCFLCDISAR